MLWYKLRRNKLISCENVPYTAYGVDVYSGLRRIRSIPDISLNRKHMVKEIRKWNRYHIDPEHLNQVVDSFVEDEATIKEKPYSQI